MPETDTIPVSASIASTGKGIRYVGKWAYCMSGAYETKTSGQQILDFTTGSGLIVGDFQLMGPCNYASPVNGAITIARIKFNDETVAFLKCDTEQEDMPAITVVKCIIPPLTKVLVAILSNEDTADELITMVFSGRVDGAE